ncbi:MAG: cupin domain-containing protein [Pseudomonadota bacterium]
MTPRVIKAEPSSEYFFEEGCYILELSNSASDPGLSIARARLTPGTATQPHKLLQTIERYIILSGSGEVFLDKQKPVSVSANDVVLIPENCSQWIRNTGEDDLLFMVLCTPRFVTDNYSECDQSNA